MKPDSLMEKSNSLSSRKNSAKAEMLKNIYGERQGTTYDFGLAETANDEDFLSKLDSLATRWERVCPGFFQWFCGNRIVKFLESVICSAGEDTGVAGLYYQNDIESMHSSKKKQQFRKENATDVITNVSTLIQQSQREEIRALYGAGRYVRFVIDSVRQHT